MDEYTAVSKDMDVIREKAKLDECCKRILANKSILAWIMKECLDEYKGMSSSDVIQYIEGTPEISLEAVHRDEVSPEKITGVTTEDKTINEGVVTYDIRFTAIIPGTENKIHLYVNIEAQNNYNPGYPLVKRGLYYCCRMISSQYEREFTNSQYDKIKKVYSLWICIAPPKERQNSITEYVLQERKIVGNSTEKKENYDLINCMMLCLGDPDGTDGILRFLDVIMSEDIDVENKKEILEKDFEIEMTREVESEVSHMCNYSDGIWMKGIKEGREEGIKEGEARGEARGLVKGREEGRAEGIEELLARMRADGIDESILQKYSGMGK